MSQGVSRRQMLAGTGVAGLGLVMSGAVSSVFGGTASAASPQGFTGYGELVPDPNGLVDLPQGFTYTVFSRAGVDKLATGEPVPGAHDGMFAFDAKHGRDILVRNHENSPGAALPVPHRPGLVYDPGCAGGTTNVTVAGGKLVSHVASLAGTYRNCAGGHTPWGTWLTCEETEATPASEAALTKKHGYVFEVDPFGRLHDAAPVPLVALGRYAHEAVAVDPHSGILYLTEDASGPFGLLYRFLPRKPLGGPGSLRAGGQLQALRADGADDLSAVTTLGTKLKVSWVDVPDPDATTTSVRKQFAPTAVTQIPKCEGIFWDDQEKVAYVVSSYAKAAPAVGRHEGQVWRLDPKRSTIELVVRIAPGGRFDGPDNITVSPYGGVVLAEDGDGENYLTAAGEDGTVYPLARNAGSDSEWAGCTFSPDRRWLYANIQGDGLTVAITGPWYRGSQH